MEWEEKNLNNKTDSLFWLFFSLLILNMLIIFFGVYSYFFNIKDYTLIAGIIAFFGAVIGGLITLIGVRRTIEANRMTEYLKKIKEELMFLFPLQREVEEISEYIWFEYNESHASFEDILIYIQEQMSIKNKLYDYAQKGDFEIYNELMQLKDKFNNMAITLNYIGSIEKLSDREAVEIIQGDINNFLKIIEKEIQLKKSELNN